MDEKGDELCQSCDDGFVDEVCDADGVTYQSLCHFHQRFVCFTLRKLNISLFSDCLQRQNRGEPLVLAYKGACVAKNGAATTQPPITQTTAAITESLPPLTTPEEEATTAEAPIEGAEGNSLQTLMERCSLVECSSQMPPVHGRVWVKLMGRLYLKSTLERLSLT